MAVQPAPAGDLDARQLLAALNSFKKGDFSVRLPEEWTGVAGKVADAFNETVEMNERMAAELERLSRAVGKEGKVNQRVSLGDVRGSWAASVQCVNALVTDLVHPTTETARVIGAVAKGDLSQTMALDLEGRPLAGEFLRTARIVNTMVEQLGAFAAEVTRVAREVGTEGKLGGQAKVKGVAGTWKDLTDNVNFMASNLTSQVRNIADVTKGDLSKEITVDVKGEILELKNTARPTFEFLHPEDQQVMRDHLRDLAAGAPTARFENRHRHGDGSYRWLAWTAAPFREEGLVYVFAQDVTFRKVAEEERLQLVREQEARRAAERENTIKDQFLATLSHELRSPLTPILGWTTMLRSGQLAPEDAIRALDVIERNAKLQAQLIDDLLDVSRIVSGKLRMDLRPIDLRGVVEAALDAVRTAAEKRRVTLAVELGPEPVRVVGDSERLQQVVWNLASNAVKFSPERGCVRVRLDLETHAARLRVCDDGVGISPEFLPHVFDRFQQATSGSTRTHGGLGLGLTIVRHIVRAHGGTAEAASDGVGCGASFTVVLPRAHGPKHEETACALPPQGGPEAHGSLLHGQTVLVVDDEPDVREVLGLVLERQGARVVTASSVGEAVAAFEAEQPDLVVSDIGMPGADGYALMDRLRSRTGEGRPVPAVALTAYAAPEDAARVRASGFRAHLAKPVDPRLVVETLARLVGEAAGRGDGEAGAARRTERGIDER